MAHALDPKEIVEFREMVMVNTNQVDISLCPMICLFAASNTK